MGKTLSPFWLHKNPQISPDQNGRGKGLGSFFSDMKPKFFKSVRTNFLIFSGGEF